ncbi:MAG: type II toxin-antitoxin system RelE/ParE family toxin [Fusobacteriaceae bacterium]|nr:type II toxin-antitoxin system RelE/ParE family toxin [Fusobacteriaceae bacterium]
MYKLIVSELAHQDLGTIVSYIVEELSNPIAASNFLDEVDKCYNYLKTNPLMYEKCQDKRLWKEGYRKVFIKKYVLLYKIDEDSKVVSIMRFFYGAQDYIKQM